MLYELDLSPELKPKSISILGSTGSVGKSTIDLILSQPESFEINVLTANSNYKLLAEQAIKLNAQHVVIGNDNYYAKLKKELAGTNISVASGYQAIIDGASIKVDLLISAIVGIAGLKASMQAIKSGNSIALANKESMVCAGRLMTNEAKKYNIDLLPIDSEHNAIFQSLEKANIESVKRLILTASGGPFLRQNRDELKDITVEQAIAHPNWSMGRKISVDSATMMNKALEVIEASYLFDMKQDKIDVLMHPQSIVHSCVEYIDGSIISQMGASDMRTPIAYALSYPNRMKTSGNSLDFSNGLNLTFEQPDINRFPALRIVREVLKNGQGQPTIFNTANEIAVDRFLNKEIAFLDIEMIVEKTLDIMGNKQINNLDDVYNLDIETRVIASEIKGIN